jgi:pyruvate/2-oxoglutarate dehydrogenase complex dihydrolipoamide dehydrogenase (E3) component
VAIVVDAGRRLIQRNLERHGIELIRGTASFLDARTVPVEQPDGSIVGAHAMARADTIHTFIDAVCNYLTLSDSYKHAACDGLGNLKR